MRKLLLFLILSFFSVQSFAGSCPDGSEPVRSISADGTYFVFNCVGDSNNAKDTKTSNKASTNNSNLLEGSVKASDINFPGKFYTKEIESCSAMSGTPSFNSSRSFNRVKGLIGYDWHADWEANSNSISPIHKDITEPIKVLMSATHNAIGNDNKANIKTAKNFLIDLAKADTLYDSIGYIEVKKKPGCYANGDINSQHWNASKYVFAEQDGGVAFSYSPWLRNLGINDINLVYLVGYKKLDKNSAISGSMRYFSLGSITFTDVNGGTIKEANPKEFALDAAYSTRLGKNLSGAFTARYINSNLTEGLTAGQKKLPAGLQKAILAKQGKKDEMHDTKKDDKKEIKEEDAYDKDDEKPAKPKPKPKKEMMNAMKEMMKEMSSKIEMLKAETDPKKMEMMKKEMMTAMKKMPEMAEMSEMMKNEMMKEMMKKMDEYGDMNAMKDEGFSSDAQRKAAFASGYKEKGKKKDEMMKMKKESIDPSCPVCEGEACQCAQSPSDTESVAEMAMNAMKMNAMKMPIRAMHNPAKKEMKTGDDDMQPMSSMKMNAMTDPKKMNAMAMQDPKQDMAAGYMKSDVRAAVKDGGGKDMAKVKDKPEMMAAMKKINATYNKEKYLPVKEGSIQDTVAQMKMTENREINLKGKELDKMVADYLKKGGVISKLPAAIAKGMKPSDMEPYKVKMKEVREFISTYNSHFLTNFKAEEFIIKG